MTEAGFQFDGDFDLEDEYEAPKLCPGGDYLGSIIDVSVRTASTGSKALVFPIILEGNDGVLTDGETSVNGHKVEFLIWLPKKGDENLMAGKSGLTKRVFKLNQVKEFADKFSFSMNNKAEMTEFIGNKDAVGTSVKVTVSCKVNDHTGRSENEVRSIYAA